MLQSLIPVTDDTRRFVARPREGAAHVLITVMMLNEGWDCPVLPKPSLRERIFIELMTSDRKRKASREFAK